MNVRDLFMAAVQIKDAAESGILEALRLIREEDVPRLSNRLALVPEQAQKRAKEGGADR